MLNLLGLKSIFDKMIGALSTDERNDLSAYLQEYLSPGITEVDTEDEPPIVDITPTETRQLTGYRYEASDNKDHIGEYYLMLPAFMSGNVDSVTIGDQAYRYVMDWQGCELWYGQPTSGDITVTLKDKTIYQATASTPSISSGNYYHHIADGANETGNMFANRTTIVLCPGQDYDKIYTDNETLKKHSSMDNGRYLFYASKVLPKGTILNCVSGSTVTQITMPGAGTHYGDCSGVATSTSLTREDGDWFGRYNGDRGTWYFEKDMKDYPSQFYLTVPGCLERALVINNGTRYEIGGKSGFVIKQSDVSGRTMALICPVSCRGTKAHIEV